MKTLKITIYSDGYIQTETVGIKGEKCENYRELFQEILQNRIVDQIYTDEYYQEEEINEVELIDREYMKI